MKDVIFEYNCILHFVHLHFYRQLKDTVVENSILSTKLQVIVRITIIVATTLFKK